jgi:hypothetical protein
MSGPLLVHPPNVMVPPMIKPRAKVFIVPIFAVCLLVASSVAASNANPRHPVVVPSGAQIPLSFEPNRGQTDPRVLYLSRSREGTIFFTEQGATVAVPGYGSFHLQFAGGKSSANFEPETLLPGRSNYLSTSAASSITNVENYGALLEPQVYPGIDVRFYGNSQHLEHDLIGAPGAEVRAITLQFDAVSNLRLDSAGNAQFQLGQLTLHETGSSCLANHRRKACAS